MATSQKAYEEAIKEIISKLKTEDIKSKKDVDRIKREVARKHNLGQLIRNSDILAHASEEDKSLIKEKLKMKSTRSISGVVIISVMIPPLPCPGKCTYCPVSSIAPKSYTGNEPAALRARMFNYDAYKQVEARLKQLEIQGHDTSKVEIIVMGGTFPSYGRAFQEEFIKGIYDALNGFKSSSLEEAKKANETAKHRCVSLTIETRPDYAKEKHIDMILKYMATRVELGVQVLSNRLMKKIKRGHTLEDVIEVTQKLKDSAYKIGYHMMPGFQKPEMDVKMFKKLFARQEFRPDMLKIYPVLVLKGTELYEEWKAGKYEPLDAEQAAEIIAKAHKYFPPYVRVMRVQRDIPAYAIEAGVRMSNLRDLVYKKMNELGIECKEIRCREAGHKYIKEGVVPKTITYKTLKYKASYGTEYFISAEDIEQDILVGYVRLRFPYKPHREEITPRTALIRELKVVGNQIPVGVRKEHGFQHKGIGKKLMSIAENIAKDKGMEKVNVISAIGTREYYRKLGYHLEGPYMVKEIK